MNKKIVFILTGAVIAALLVGIGLGRVIFPPSDGHAHAPADTSAAMADSNEPSIWTCSMHPQIQQPEPGDCPICGMVNEEKLYKEWQNQDNHKHFQASDHIADTIIENI